MRSICPAVSASLARLTLIRSRSDFPSPAHWRAVKHVGGYCGSGLGVLGVDHLLAIRWLQETFCAMSKHSVRRWFGSAGSCSPRALSHGGRLYRGPIYALYF